MAYKPPVQRDPNKPWTTIAYRNTGSAHSFRQGSDFGERLAKNGKVYLRDSLKKLIHSMRVASNQDWRACKLGTFMGYLEEAKRQGFYDKDDEITEQDMIDLKIVS